MFSSINQTSLVKMGLFAQLKTLLIIHLIFGYVFVVSGLIINFLMLCTTVIWPFNKTLYRKIVVTLSYLHWCQFSWLGQWWSGSDSILYIDPKDEKYLGHEHCVIVLNHYYEMDWMMVWILAERYGFIGNTKIYGKNILKFVPILGWAWYFTESIFLQRNWAKDKKLLEDGIDNLTAYPDNYWINILTFPEGTRFTPEKHKVSLEVAQQKGYPEYRYHLLPRTKGFVVSVKKMQGKIPAIYDMTIAYPKDQKEASLWDMIQGKPFTYHVQFRRVEINDIPSDEEACSEWLRKLYKEKDDALHKFFETGKFDLPAIRVPKKGGDLFVWACWTVLLCIPLFYYLGKLFMAGTILQQAIFAVIVILGCLVIKWMIGFTEIHKASSYGKDVKADGTKKKD